MKKEGEARLRALVPAPETISAVGTAEHLSQLGANIGSGGGFTFVVITERRLLFAPWDEPQRPHQEIVLGDVAHWASGTQYNAHAIVLTHPAMTRQQHVPARRFLWFRWGNAEADVTRTETIFRFSSPNTQAAKALRAALTSRSVPHEDLHLEERSREERTRGSHKVLTAMKKER